MKTTEWVKKTGWFFLVTVLLISCDRVSHKKNAASDSTVTQSTSPADTNSGVDTKDAAQGDRSQKWKADATGSVIQFSVDGPFGTVHGSLAGLNAAIFFDENNLAGSSIRASVDPTTIKTGIAMRNHHLQKEKFLNSESYPAIRFSSEKIEKDGTGYKAIGSLTLKGVTKHVEIPFHFSKKEDHALFKGSFVIRREDYTVGKPGGSIGNSIMIQLEVPATRSAS